MKQMKGAKSAAAAEKKPCVSAAAGGQSSMSREVTLCTQLTGWKT